MKMTVSIPLVGSETLGTLYNVVNALKRAGAEDVHINVAHQNGARIVAQLLVWRDVFRSCQKVWQNRSHIDVPHCRLKLAA